MKTKFFLAAGLIVSAFSFGQVNLPPTGASNEAGNPFSNNVHIGEASGAVESGDNNNVFVGYFSGNSNTSGHSNVFLGLESGISNTQGLSNVFLGTRAGYNNSVGFYNTYVGFAAGVSANYAANENSYFGTNSGREAIGSLNVFLGSSSGLSSTGSKNVCVGVNAGFIAGANNVMLGYNAGSAEEGNNKLYIDNSASIKPLIYGDFTDGSEELKFNVYKVGIGSDFGAFPTLTFSNQENYRLFVRGGILAEEVRVRIQADWADYVFNDNYKLLSLKETEQYITKNGHLPNMPSAAQVKEEGIEVGNIVKLQQEKIEELTLHLIKQDKEIEILKEQNKQLLELKAQVQLLLKKQ